MKSTYNFSGNLGWTGFSELTDLLKREELIAEINFKNRELANITMHLVERGRLLSRVRDELQALRKSNPAFTDSRELRRILKALEEAEKHRNDWEQFSVHFDEIHRNFLTSLKSRFPVLSITDLKLCAYLRLNLSSKEIANSMNITLKGVEVSRYRLRKKLNISRDVNLLDFLLQVSGSEKQAMKPESNSLTDDLANFLSFFNKSMTAKFISQGGYNFSGEGILKRSAAHNK